MAKAGIYCLQNKRDGKMYIGSSKDIPERLMTHIRQLESGTHSNKMLQRAFDEDGLSLTVLEDYDSDNLKIDLLEREQMWISKYDTTNPKYGYNKINSQTHADLNRRNVKNLTRPSIWYIIMDEFSKTDKNLRVVWNIAKRLNKL
jgi:group I intron endonuclease